MNRHLKSIALRRAGLSLVLIFVSCVAAVAADVEIKRIGYRLEMSQPASHLYEVSMEVVVDDKRAAELDFQMPRWSPGRYAVFDFAKNVREVRASVSCDNPNCTPEALPLTRMDDQTWRVQTRGKRGVVLKYKVFADDLSGTFSQLDQRHANFNGGSVFMYLVGHKQEPVELVIEPPAGWRIINGRTEREDQKAFKFPNYDLLIDTPTEIAPDWTREEFKVDGKTYRVVVHSFGDEGGKRKELVRDIEKIVRAETSMWGTPEFDSYTFLIHFAADDRSGDGMEHLNSTQIIEPGALAEPGTYESALSTVSHEFFHVWNVKRLRPIELGPWDFTRPVATRSLWIAEGVTNYYGHLMLRRAGVWTDAEFLERMAEQVGDIENAPGARLTSPEEASILAPLQDRALSVQRNDMANTALSYYTKGETIGLVLDLLIRGRTRGKKSLDDVMREMYRRFYLTSPNQTYYLRGRGYRPEDFERVASEVAGFDLREFFERYVRSAEMPPYTEALAGVGLRLVRAPAIEAYTAGIMMSWEEGEAAEIRSVRHGSPAETAGLSQGDTIVSIGTTPVTQANWREALNRFKQGDRVPVTLRRDRRTIQTSITLGPPDNFTYSIAELEGATPEMRALRAAWTGKQG